MRTGLLVVAAMPAELPRGLASLGVTGLVVGVRARELEARALPGSGPVLVTGTCGSLVAGIAAGELVLARAVAAESGALAPSPGLTAALEAAVARAGLRVRSARFAHADSVVEGDARGRLAARLDAEIADLETALVARACERAGRPWAALRVVSDSPEAPLAWLAEMLGGFPEEPPGVGQVLAGLARRPAALPRLVGLARLLARGRADVRATIARLPG